MASHTRGNESMDVSRGLCVPFGERYQGVFLEPHQAPSLRRLPDAASRDLLSLLGAKASIPYAELLREVWWLVNLPDLLVQEPPSLSSPACYWI